MTSWTSSVFEASWDRVYRMTYYFTNDLAVELNKKIFTPVLDATSQYVKDKEEEMNEWMMAGLLAVITGYLAMLFTVCMIGKQAIQAMLMIEGIKREVI